MQDIFFCADHHFFHNSVLTFPGKDNGFLRDFDNVEEMNEHIIERHNSVVKPEDKVYFLGDVTLRRNANGLYPLHRMNGIKVLVRGNHDQCKVYVYQEFFKDVRAYHEVDKFVCSHIPIHPFSMKDRWAANIHGHTHDRIVTDSHGKPDKKYICVSMETINYVPVHLDEIKARVK